MGNTDCCCARGKSEKLPNDDPIKAEEILNANQSISSKNKSRILDTEENANNLSQSFSSKAGTERNGYMSEKRIIFEKDAKIHSNFQTFGGEIMNVEDYTSINNKENKINLITVNSQNNSKNSNELNLNSSDDGRSIKIQNKIFIRICVESLSIIYKKLEDFGIFFNPYIVIKIESEIPQTILPVGGENSNLTESNLDKSLNTSGLSDLDNTTILNMSQVKSNTSYSIQTKKEKILNFKFSDCYEIPDQYAYTKVVFMIKNENIPGTAGEENFNQKSNSFPPICLGEAKIPINIIYKNFKENSFEGNIELKLRENTTFGYLKVKLSASNKFEVLKIQDQFTEKLSKGKILDYQTEDSKANFYDKTPGDNNIFDLMSNQSLKNSLYVWDDYLTNYEDLNPTIFVKYFASDIKIDLQEALILASKIPRLRNNLRHDRKETRDTNSTIKLEHSEMSKYLNDIIKQNNNIALYQFLNYLADLSLRDDFYSIEEILKSLNDKDKEFLVNLPKSHHDNIFMIKVYLTFVNNYVKHYKYNKLSAIRINKDLQDNIIILNLIEIFNQIFKKSGNLTNLLPEYISEMRECAMISLNITCELITQPIDVSLKMTFEEKKKEYNAIYDNCLQFISARNSILRLLQLYIMESQIIAIIFRIFRKILQVLTNDNSSLLNEKQLKPKDFAKSLRKFLIQQHEGIFISTLKTYLLRYHHYPETHNNILLIIYQLTNNCDSNLLYFIAKKIDMDFFSDVFDSYKGRIKNSYFRTLNNVHLSILTNLCEVDRNSEKFVELMQFITKELKSFYPHSDENKKRKQEFTSKKLEHVEIHEIVTRIGVKLTKYKEVAILLKNSYFFYDIVEYIYTIAYNEFIQDRKVNKKNQTSHTDFSKEAKLDFITKVTEKKKNFNKEEIGQLVCSILENTLNIFLNLISSEDIELYEMLTSVNVSLLSLMLDKCMNLLTNHNINANTFGELINKFTHFFEDKIEENEKLD